MKASRKLLLALPFAVMALLEPLVPGLLSALENRAADHLVRMHATRHVADDDIVIVDIDEASLARMAEEAGRWPWPRSVHGDLVAALARQRPRAIVFDIQFIDRDRYRPDADAHFNEVLRANPGIYLPHHFVGPGVDETVPTLGQLAGALGISLDALADRLGLTAAGGGEPQTVGECIERDAERAGQLAQRRHRLVHARADEMVWQVDARVGAQHLVEMGVGIRPVAIAVDELDVEDDRARPLPGQCGDQVTVHRAWPRPAPRLLGHPRQARLVDVDDDDVVVGDVPRGVHAHQVVGGAVLKRGEQARHERLEQRHDRERQREEQLARGLHRTGSALAHGPGDERAHRVERRGVLP